MTHAEFQEKLYQKAIKIYHTKKAQPGKESPSVLAEIMIEMLVYAKELRPKEDRSVLREDVGDALELFRALKRIYRHQANPNIPEAKNPGRMGRAPSEKKRPGYTRVNGEWVKWGSQA